MTQKLYKIKLQGILGDFYVVDTDSSSAYEQIRGDLDHRNYGFSKDRELKSIELLAEDTEYPDCETRLYC